MLGTVKNSIIKKIFPCTLAKHFSDCLQPSKNILSDDEDELTLGAPTEALSGQIGSVKVGEHTVDRQGRKQKNVCACISTPAEFN